MKARTTRMPVICSRSTWLTRSMRSCMSWNWGTIREITSPMGMTRRGMAATRMSERAPSSCTARMVPPMMVIGAATNSVHIMTTRIWTWVTSLVMRLMSDGAPKWPTSWAEYPVTRWNRPARTSRPKAMAALAP